MTKNDSAEWSIFVREMVMLCDAETPGTKSGG